MNAEERAVASVLRRVANQAPLIKPRPDTWARGRRRRRLRHVTAFAGVVALVALTIASMGWSPRPQQTAPIQEQRSVPAEITLPMPWQPNLVDAPNGPASVILTGPGGFGANDVFGYDDRAIVVGRDGLYRYVRAINGVNAGEDLLLSPDGRYLAGGADLEGAQPTQTSADWQSTASVMDLSTGEVRTYRHGPPVAWSPDGRLLVGIPLSLTSRRCPCRLLDPVSGVVTAVGAGGATSVAFSPDGQRMAIQVDTELKIVDLPSLADTTVADLGSGWMLAGPGAWRPDGRIGIWRSSGCAPQCAAGVVDHRLSLVDAESGAVYDGGRAPVRGVSARLLGWQADDDAIVAATQTAHVPEGPHAGLPQVLALDPDGGRTELITVPDGTDRIDIARDLLDHFGGQPRSGWDLLLDTVAFRGLQLLPFAVALIVLAGAWLIYRRRRDGWWPTWPRRARGRARGR